MAEVEKTTPIPGTALQIHGLYREVPGVPNAPIVVLVHCLTAGKNSTKYYLAARAFEQAGYCSFRYDQYGFGDDARKFLDCTVLIHVADLELVVGTLRAEQPDRPITVVGHSLGGLTILLTRRRAFDAAVLWDTSHTGIWQERTASRDATGEGEAVRREFEDDHTIWEPRLGCYRFHWAYDILVSEAMLRSMRTVDCTPLIGQLHKPVKLIAAGNTTMLPWQQVYYEHANRCTTSTPTIPRRSW